MSGGKRNTAVNLTTIPMGNGRRGAYIVAGVDLKTGASWWSHHGLKLTREEAHAMAARQLALRFLRPFAVVRVTLKPGREAD
jgi:hypothetical protein